MPKINLNITKRSGFFGVLLTLLKIINVVVVFILEILKGCIKNMIMSYLH